MPPKSVWEIEEVDSSKQMSSLTDWLDLIVTLFKSFKLSPLLELESEFLLLVLSADAGSSPEDWLLDDSLDDSTGATVHNSDICKREVEKLRISAKLYIPIPITLNIELYNNTLHGLSPPGGLVSPSGGFASLLCDQGLHLH